MPTLSGLVEKKGRVKIKAFDDQISGWDQFHRDDAPCIHAVGCLQAKREALPFPVKQSVLNLMAISSDWKQKIWLKARSDGPLVQRVSSTVVINI
jgi:hypothetical protein